MTAVEDRGALVHPQSDGYRVHAIPCGALAGPDHGGLTRDSMPTDQQMDTEIARMTAEREKRWPTSRLEGSGY